ncbi:hypothetical protein Q5X48_03340 [Acinetobacter baumannii]|nr:hypothetical protein [Acinetobacter baumannii]
MAQSRLSSFLMLINFCFFTACTEENGNYMAGVSLGGTGTGNVSIGPHNNPVVIPKPDIHPDHIKVEEEYIIDHPGHTIQYCGGIERKIQFVNESFPFSFLNNSEKLNFFELKDPLEKKYRMDVTMANTTSNIIYKYVNGCQAAFQLIGSKVNKSKANFCLNDEIIKAYQPNKSRIYYYTFKLPSLLGEWQATYDAQYSNILYTSNRESSETNLKIN